MSDPMQGVARTWHTRGCRVRCALRCVDDPGRLLGQIARGYTAAAGSSCECDGGGSGSGSGSGTTHYSPIVESTKQGGPNSMSIG